ncbi:UNVERIFIED_ORG: hypothetical protein QE446_001844 [Rhizobium sp. SORGH_AS260]|nr:hypothetical protein [Rhizobium sp. SORGH_AS_0285]MDP9753987.1 hypothetical protein [Rhizobium sp. SORGH_AS_0260]MDR6080965.1 hypothetical protein [Agrobacterium sp. SORGH_AS_0440]
MSSISTKHRQKAKVIVRRGWHSLDRLEIADLNADGARDDQGIFELATRLARFELDDEAFTRSGTGSKPGLRPAESFTFLLDSIARNRVRT